MKSYRVEIAARAEHQLRAIAEWWKAERPAAPDLFLDEFATALEHLSKTAKLGSPYRVANPEGVRRILLPRTRHHVYYTVSERQRTVTIRSSRS